MTVDELKEVLEKNALTAVCFGRFAKRFVMPDEIFQNGILKKMPNTFGIYRRNDGIYCYFVTDSKMGIPEYLAVYTTESAACEALLEAIILEEAMCIANKPYT